MKRKFVMLGEKQRTAARLEPLLCIGIVVCRKGAKMFPQEAGGEMLSSNTPALSLGTEGRIDGMEAEHQVKGKSTAAALVTGKSQLALSRECGDISNLLHPWRSPQKS